MMLLVMRKRMMTMTAIVLLILVMVKTMITCFTGCPQYLRKNAGRIQRQGPAEKHELCGACAVSTCHCFSSVRANR